jgi:hypothetical protein
MIRVLALLPLLLACGPTQHERILMSVTVPGPTPYDHAFERFMIYGVGYPDLWRIAGATEFAILEDGVPLRYAGFVVEVVLENEKIPALCESGNHSSLYAWRPLADSTGIEALTAYVPPRKPGEVVTPLGPGELCFFRPQPRATARMTYLIDGLDPSNEVLYRSQSGTISAHRHGLEYGKPCADPPSRSWKWGDGATCLAFTYETWMHGQLARISDSTLAMYARDRSAHLQARLTGIRVTINCAIPNPFPMYCRD